MRSSVARKLIISVICILIICCLVMILVVYNINKTIAKDNAKNFLNVFETQIVKNEYTTKEEYRKFVESNAIDNVRITIIGFDGVVIADSQNDDESVMDNHINRTEIATALTGGVGFEIRNSQTMGVKFLYIAKKVNVQNLQSDSFGIILRVAMPITSINSYVYGILGVTLGVFLIMLIITIALSSMFSQSIIKPFKLIKSRLDDVGMSNDSSAPIVLTKYDDVNQILAEIDEISDRLSENIAEIRLEKQKIDFIVENLNQGVVAIDKDRRVVLCNTSARKLSGFNSELPNFIYVVFHKESVLKNIESSLINKQTIKFDERDEERILNYRILPIESDFIELIIVIQDVTDVRKLGIEKQEFFENAGHKLKTPLSSILGYSEVLLRKDEFNRKFIETINKEALKMNDLIADMLKISELNDDCSIVDEYLNMEEIVGQVITDYSPKAVIKNITISSKLEKCYIFANREKIAEVVSNLIGNAIKYSNENGNVVVGLRLKKSKVILTVQDNGIGIPKESINRIFERFYRVNKGSSVKEDGTGLGLAIVKHICNHYKAKISVKSKLNEGSTFTVEFSSVVQDSSMC